MLRVQIARMPAELRQAFPGRENLRAAEAVVYVGGAARYAGSVAASWGPFVDRSKWTVWDWDGNAQLRGGIEKVGGRVFQLVRHGDDIVVLYGSNRSGAIKSEPTVEIAGQEYRLPSNLREVQAFEFGDCSFRWQRPAGWPELHLYPPSVDNLLAYVGFGYDLWKGAYFEVSGK